MIEVAREGRVLEVALNRPEKRNALDLAACRELNDALEHADGDSDVGAVLLWGHGPVFCAGMDLKEALETDQIALKGAHERLFTTIERIRRPVIAAAQGAALAAGTGLAANAHIVIAAPEAVFGLTEIRVGLWPLVVFRSVALAVGERTATEWSITGRHVPAAEAHAAGLVTEIAEDPLPRARAIAQSVAAFSSSAMAEGLHYIRTVRGMNWESAGRTAGEARDRLMSAKDFRAGVDAFLNRRK